MIRKFKSSDGKYNMTFNTEDGFMARWGETPNDDPVMCPVGPEIADIEISTVCHGVGKDMENRTPCSFCLPPGQRICVSGGSKPVETIRVGDVIFGFDLQSKRPREQQVVECYDRQFTGSLVELTLADGRQLLLTPEHPVILLDGTSKLAGDLTVNDEVLTR